MLRSFSAHSLSSGVPQVSWSSRPSELKGGVEEAQRFMNNTTLPISAPSLGGVETLITRPATTSHSGISADNRKRLGISDQLIRLSVGIEATEDIIGDFDDALRG